MKWHHYDIVRKASDKSAIWLDAASDLSAAESRIAELTSFWLGGISDYGSTQSSETETIIGPSATTRVMHS
jgi:Trm5-related predicted tRNA methylase